MNNPAAGTWHVYGLEVMAPWALSAVPSPVGAHPDLTIVLGEEHPALAEGMPGKLMGESRVEGHVWEAAYASDGMVSLLFPDILVATFDVERRRCELHPDPGVDQVVLRRLVTTAVLATWMILTDIPVLHASAVRIDGAAVIFVGRSGSGKSTIAAALVGTGATAITDDVCRLTEHDRGWVVHPDSGQVRLREGSHALATMFRGDEVVTTPDRVMLCLPTVEAPVPVAAIVVPRISHEARSLAATRLRGTGAVLAVLEHPRMASLMGDDLSRSLFQFASSLVTAVPTWELVLPRAAVTPRLGAELLAEVSQVLASP